MRKTFRALLAAVLLCASLVTIPAAPAAAAEIVITPDGYTAPPIKIAIVRSQTTIDWLNRRKTPGSYPHGSKETKTLEYLRGRGYNVTQIIGDRDLLNYDLIKQYDVIVLPQVFAMSRKASMSLVRYVALGGGLVEFGATPRAAPEYQNPPGTKNDMRDWWWRQYKSNVWEWGPLSQVYQARMVNDAWTLVYGINPNPNSSIVASASAILEARGYSGGAAVSLLRSPQAGLELTRPLKHDPYIQNICNFNIMNATIKRQYPYTYSAGSAAKYYNGRSAHFYFGVNEFIKNYSTSLWSIKASSGVPQGEIAGAWLEAAIQWAAVKDGVAGPTTAKVTAKARVKARTSGMTTTVVVRNGSPLVTYGAARVRVYTASGRLVHSYKKRGIVTVPGSAESFSHKWRKRLGGGKYTVRITYEAGYPATSRLATSSAVVSRGHTVVTQ
jgi:hypothetical protein